MVYQIYAINLGKRMTAVEAEDIEKRKEAQWHCLGKKEVKES